MSEDAPTKWVNFGREALQNAKKGSGLTNPQIAERLGFSTSTWDRALKTGRVNSEHLHALVALFGIPAPDGYEGDRTPWIMLRALEDIRAGLREIRELLERQATRGSD